MRTATPAILVLLREAATNGQSLQEASDLIGRSYSATYHLAQRYDICFASERRRTTNRDVVLLREAAMNGETLASACRRIGVGYHTAACVARKLGLYFSHANLHRARGLDGSWCRNPGASSGSSARFLGAASPPDAGETDRRGTASSRGSRRAGLFFSMDIIEQPTTNWLPPVGQSGQELGNG